MESLSATGTEVARDATPWDWRGAIMAVLPGLMGLGLLVGIWALVSLLRPVSPLTWLPIGLLVFKGTNPAVIWTIFICSVWPMVIKTAVGVQRVPQDYMDAVRVLNSSEWKIFTKILFPAVLPYMLTGGVSIGFWVWDEWNNLNVKNIMIAIFVIGVVGMLREILLIKIASAFTFEEVKS